MCKLLCVVKIILTRFVYKDNRTSRFLAMLLLQQSQESEQFPIT